MNGMVSCKNCMAHNSLDSAFCKKCGANLPADDLQQAREKLEAAVADGYRIFSTGRTDEAIQIADAAVQANPASTAALSLKAMCHERLGQISEALECHEKVLEIDPDSMIDKIKVNDLRNLLVARTSIAAVPDRRMAIVGAVAAFVLILSVLVVVAKSGSRPSEKLAENSPISNPAATGSHFDPGAGVQQSVQSQPGTQTQSTPPPNSGAATQPSSPKPQDRSDQSSHRDDNRIQLPPDGGTSLPNVDGNRPLILDPGPIGRTTTQTSTKPPAPSKTLSHSDDPGIDPPPSTDDGHNGNQTRSAPGIMDIQIVSGPGKKPGDSTDPSTHPNGVQALLRTAQSQYQIGNYPAAATSYERALRAGASPASGNQRLAQCYEKLGKNSEAVAAYGRAIEALQSEISAGRGDKDRLSAALDSCKQAVKVLGG